MGKRLNPLMFLSCVMICFYHPSKFSGHIRLVEQLACCPRPDGPWVEMYYPHQKKAMRCVHQLLLLQPPTRLVHEHWAHTGRSLRTSHSQSTSAEEALWSITSLWSTEPWPVHLPRLYLTSWGVIQVLFLQAISFLWAPFLLFLGVGRYLLKWDPWDPPLVFISGLALRPVLFGSYKATTLHHQKKSLILIQSIAPRHLTELQYITTEVGENYLPTFSVEYINSMYINHGTTN